MPKRALRPAFLRRACACGGWGACESSWAVDGDYWRDWPPAGASDISLTPPSRLPAPGAKPVARSTAAKAVCEGRAGRITGWQKEACDEGYDYGSHRGATMAISKRADSQLSLPEFAGELA
ncbi:uncharacterized protein K452DRAFT_97025 [Aplosporella prunicola CBS 121167]|uniref:Uncharacterized protein n=1 Tax=Aplosporella prunicola CBS 121167 TaxID=1176127 RepID=A0A6A6B3T1_9PEZI|nr:uncharacterized protein K452DRAFT_97025 [Aplosporella prunicola CBS 121167]KAF2137925.1 hypothetical protein K452DRAFT_97025 [Aplosporella prunicola CBS 121167]